MVSDSPGVEARQEQPISCIFQEPRFSPGDIEFLSSMGHEVVESPGAFEEVGGQTMVYGIHLYRPVYNESIQKAIPVVFIGTGWEVWDGLVETAAHSFLL
jgi:hypothetical protein